MLKYLNDKSFNIPLEDIKVKNLSHILKNKNKPQAYYDFNIVHRDALR